MLYWVVRVLFLACKGARRGTPPGPGVQTPCSPQGVRPQGPGGALIYPKRRPLRLSICNSSKYTINETFDTKNSPQKCRNFEIFSWVLSFSLSFELFSLEFFSRWPKIKPALKSIKFKKRCEPCLMSEAKRKPHYSNSSILVVKAMKNHRSSQFICSTE